VLITAVLKTYFHLSHMGVPEPPGEYRRPVWISRGAISIFHRRGHPGRTIGPLGWLGLAAALSARAQSSGGCGVFAMMVMVYHASPSPIVTIVLEHRDDAGVELQYSFRAAW
jgi:hypothetical protein